MAPFGFMDDGLGEDSFTDDDGERWFNTSEYGETAGGMDYMWKY